MPYAWRYCPFPGCPNVTKGGRCPQHAQRRASSSARGYSPGWAERAGSPPATTLRCQVCGQQATTWDHHPVSRARLITQGVPDPDAPHRLRPLCTPCHSRHTVTHDGGFGRAKLTPT